MSQHLSSEDVLAAWAQDATPTPTQPVPRPPVQTIPTAAVAAVSILLAVAAAVLGYRIIRGGKGL